MKDKTSKLYDLESEELLLAAAINIRKLATSPRFHSSLFTAERAELCNAIISIARREESFTAKHLEICGCSEAAILAFSLIKDLEGYPDTGEFEIIAEKLTSLSVARHVRGGARDLHADASSLTAKELVQRVNEFANSSQNLLNGSDVKPMLDGADLNELIDDIRRRIESPDQLSGISTGMGMAFDRAIDGLQPGRLVLIGGRPHLGKTSLGIQFASGVMENGKSCAYFSAEMTKLHLQQAMLDLHSGIKIVPGIIPTKGELQKIKLAATTISKFKWHIDDTSRMDIDSICAKSRILHRTKGLDCIVIDYIQILCPSDTKDDMRLGVSEISGKLKALSKELNIPVVALSQINRTVARTDPKSGAQIYPKPTLANLKESSSLESDSDVVLMLDRNLEAEDPKDPEVDCDIIIGKNRQTGLLCTIPVKFVRAHRAFRVKNFWACPW